jgi:predicted nucleic acid-binding protein
LCADLLELVLLEHDLILGQNVLRELDKALRVKIRLPAATAADIAEFLCGEATQVIDSAEAADIESDPHDARVLGEALAGHAEVFVTGDAALLTVGLVDTLRIISPRQFWEALHGRGR